MKWRLSRASKEQEDETQSRLAQHGLRYNNFHTTALCSPTRDALKPPAIKDCAALSADETADVGIDLGTPVVEAIGAEAKSRFSGRIPKLTVDVK